MPLGPIHHRSDSSWTKARAWMVALALAGAIAPAAALAVATSPLTDLPGEFPDSLFRNGDLVFQRGEGIVPPLLASLLSDCRGFCHVGVVVLRGGQIYVAHVTPGDRLHPGCAQLETLASFLDPSETRRAALYRVTGLDPGVPGRAADRAARFAAEALPFDWEFDLSTTDRLYCTELVWLAYRGAGQSLVREKNLRTRTWRGKRRCIITPGSLLRYANLKLVATLRGGTAGHPSRHHG